MSKVDELTQEIISEYKAGNSERRVFLQTIKAALLAKEKDKGELTSDDEISVLKAELKGRQQAKAEYENAGRADLGEKMDFEIAELQKMLPEPMSEEEVEKVVREVIESSEDKSFGNIMKEAMVKLKGQADGSVVSRKVKQILAPLEAK